MKGKNLIGRQLYSPRKFFLPAEAYDSLEGILIPHHELQERVKSLAEQIATDYANTNLYALSIINGAIPFFTDLFFNNDLTIPFEYNCARTSSYPDGTNNTTLKIENFNLNELKGKDVLIVEDIVDTGHTLDGLLRYIGNVPRSIRTVALLDKPERREVQIEADYIGFVIPNVFVVGYGLDYNKKFRYLKAIGVLKKSVYKL